jgi:hypothetical protein
MAGAAVAAQMQNAAPGVTAATLLGVAAGAGAASRLHAEAQRAQKPLTLRPASAGSAARQTLQHSGQMHRSLQADAGGRDVCQQSAHGRVMPCTARAAVPAAAAAAPVLDS